MKKNILKFASLFLFSAVVFTGCEEDTVTFDSRNGQSIASFRADGQELAVNSEGESSVIVLVDVSTVSNQDRAVVVTIDPDRSTAEAGDYTIDPASLVVPAGAYNAEIRIIGNFDELPDSGDVALVLNLESVEGAALDTDTRVATTVNIYKVCPIETSLAGTHSYVLYNVTVGAGAGEAGTNYPDYSSSGTVTWTNADAAAPNAGVYKTSDLSFGLFPALGYAPANSASVRLTWVCSSIKPSGPDQYGDTYTYTISSVQGSVMSLHFINTWGDAGYVDLIRQDGEAWPDLLQTN